MSLIKVTSILLFVIIFKECKVCPSKGSYLLNTSYNYAKTDTNERIGHI